MVGMTSRHDLCKLLVFMGLAASWPAVAAWGQSPPKKPATVNVAVATEGVAPGEPAELVFTVVPAEGVKINRYPKIKVRVEAVDGLVGEAATEYGNAKPPPANDMESNYFKKPEPIVVDLQLSPSAATGEHQLRGEVKYYYCVSASGYCAPAKAEVTIPLEIR